MTVIAGATVGDPPTALVVGAESSIRWWKDGKALDLEFSLEIARGDGTGWWRSERNPLQSNKLHPLSTEHPILAAVAGATTGIPELLGQIAAGLDGEDPAHPERALQHDYRLEDVARLIAGEIHTARAEKWKVPGHPSGCFVYVAGFDGGGRRPLVYYALIGSEGIREFGRTVHGKAAAFVSPRATAAELVLRQLRQAPRTEQAAGETVRRLLQAQIDECARHPDPDISAAGPIRLMVLRPGSPAGELILGTGTFPEVV